MQLYPTKTVMTLTSAVTNRGNGQKKWKEHLPDERAIADKIRRHTESFIFTLISCNGGFES